MNTEEKKELESLREEVNRLREEVDRLTKMNVSLAAGSESLLKRNMDLYTGSVEYSEEDLLPSRFRKANLSIY